MYRITARKRETMPATTAIEMSAWLDGPVRPSRFSRQSHFDEGAVLDLSETIDREDPHSTRVHSCVWRTQRSTNPSSGVASREHSR
jgi:hypothetical protein